VKSLKDLEEMIPQRTMSLEELKARTEIFFAGDERIG
jgi:hypothetical protein